MMHVCRAPPRAPKAAPITLLGTRRGPQVVPGTSLVLRRCPEKTSLVYREQLRAAVPGPQGARPALRSMIGIQERTIPDPGDLVQTGVGHRSGPNIRICRPEGCPPPGLSDAHHRRGPGSGQGRKGPCPDSWEKKGDVPTQRLGSYQKWVHDSREAWATGCAWSNTFGGAEEMNSIVYESELRFGIPGRLSGTFCPRSSTRTRSSFWLCTVAGPRRTPPSPQTKNPSTRPTRVNAVGATHRCWSCGAVGRPVQRRTRLSRTVPGPAGQGCGVFSRSKLVVFRADTPQNQPFIAGKKDNPTFDPARRGTTYRESHSILLILLYF